MRGLYPVFQVTELAAGYRDTTRQTLQPVPSVPETVRPSDEPPARRPTRH